MKPHHPRNHIDGSRYKNSRLFQVTPKYNRVIVRINEISAPDICSHKLVDRIPETWFRVSKPMLIRNNEGSLSRSIFTHNKGVK